ncbi:MAG: tetratricopeptide repeat protein [Puniceicoccaceae bacterium]
MRCNCIAELLFDAGQWSQSRRHLHRAIQLLPDYHLFHFLKARCLIESGSIREGQKELEYAISQTQSVEVRAKYQRHLDALLSIDSSGTSGT